MTEPIEIDDTKSKKAIQLLDENFSSDDELPLKSLQKTITNISSNKDKSAPSTAAVAEEASNSGIEWKPTIGAGDKSDKTRVPPVVVASPNSSTDSNPVEKKKAKHIRQANELSTSSSGLSSSSSSGSSSENEEGDKKSKPAEELIFTPMITYEKKSGVKERLSPVKKAGVVVTDEEEMMAAGNEVRTR